MKEYKKNAIILILLISFAIFGYLPKDTVDDASFLMYRFGLGLIQISSGGIMKVIENMFPLIFVICIEGIRIYRHDLNGSVYYFIRQKDIKKWYKDECKLMLKNIFILFTVYEVVGLILGCILFRSMPTYTLFYIAFSQCTMFTLYVFLFALSANIVCNFVGTEIAYVIVMGIQLICVLSIMMFEKIDITSGNIWLLRFNPIASISIMWHYIPGINTKVINGLGIQFDVLTSVMYLLILSAIVYYAGKGVYCKKDIAMDNKEERG